MSECFLGNFAQITCEHFTIEVSVHSKPIEYKQENVMVMGGEFVIKFARDRATVGFSKRILRYGFASSQIAERM
jgi:hypothetical protein